MSKVSVIVPCYNQAEYLQESLNSVLFQTYQDWECIIVNDGSSDDTEIVAKHYCSKDNRFKYLYKENGGLSSSRNFGIKNASGEYILPLDADDYISSDYIELAINIFKRHPEVKLVYSDLRLFGTENKEINDSIFSVETLKFHNQIFCSCIYRKEDFFQTEGYDENMKFGLEDWEFLLRFLKSEKEVYKIPKTCFYYRKKDNSMLKDLMRNREKINHMHDTIFLKHYDLYTGEVNPINLYNENANLKAKINNYEKRFIFKLENKMRNFYRKLRSKSYGKEKY